MDGFSDAVHELAKEGKGLRIVGADGLDCRHF